MKLIREVVEQVEYLTEEKDGKKNLYIVGPFLVSEKQNKNGRLYKEETMAREVDRYKSEYISKNRAFGELGHPDTPAITLERVSHRIVDLNQEGTIWVGKALILETTMGMNAKKMIEGGCQLGVSSRGMGSLKNINGVNVVQDDFYLATAADIVADPSAPGAFVQGIMEGVEFWYDETSGTWVKEAVRNLYKNKWKYSQSEVEKVSLQIFENFVNRLGGR